MLVGTAEVPVKRERIAMPPVLDSGSFATKGTIVATGSSPAYYYESTSWDAAEKNARIEAALSLYVRIRGLEGHIPGQDVQTLVIATDVVLRNVQTIARAIDSKTGERTVFVRVPCETTQGP